LEKNGTTSEGRPAVIASSARMGGRNEAIRFSQPHKQLTFEKQLIVSSYWLIDARLTHDYQRAAIGYGRTSTVETIDIQSLLRYILPVGIAVNGAWFVVV
jgi:hypothetical protein